MMQRSSFEFSSPHSFYQQSKFQAFIFGCIVCFAEILRQEIFLWACIGLFHVFLCAGAIDALIETSSAAYGHYSILKS